MKGTQVYKSLTKQCLESVAHPERSPEKLAASERCGEARLVRPNESTERVASGSEESADTLRCGCGALGPGRSVCVCEQLGTAEKASSHAECSGSQESDDSGGPGEARSGVIQGARVAECDWWAVEPNMGRVAHGIPARVDRLRGLGNAVVPQIPEMSARRIAALLAKPDCRCASCVNL